MLLYNPVLDLTTLGWTQGVPRATALSPLLHVEAGQPPALLTHGTEDKCVPVEQAHRFARAMQEAGNRCDLIVLDGIAHAFVLAGYTAPEEVVVHAIRAGDRFLASLGYLRGRPTLKRHPRRRVRTRLFDIP
jgi:acetyl esterase/lipase